MCFSITRLNCVRHFTQTNRTHLFGSERLTTVPRIAFISIHFSGLSHILTYSFITQNLFVKLTLVVLKVRIVEVNLKVLFELVSQKLKHNDTLHKDSFSSICLCINFYSCIDIYSYSCLHPLSNERKSMFKSGDSRAV